MLEVLGIIPCLEQVLLHHYYVDLRLEEHTVLSQHDFQLGSPSG